MAERKAPYRASDSSGQCATAWSAWAEEEKDLVKLMMGMERQIAWMEGQKTGLMRQVRRTTHAEEGTNGTEASFSGSYADASDDSSSSWEDNSEAKVPKTKQVKQVTLTRWFGGEGTQHEEDNNDGTDENSLETGAGEEDSEDGDTDWWEDTLLHPGVSWGMTKMNDFTLAMRKSESAIGGAWNKATATERDVDEDVALRMMTDLMDEAMYSSKREKIVFNEDDIGNKDATKKDFQGGEGTNETQIFLGDPTVTDVIERMCPCWKENTEFLQTVTDRGALIEALDEVACGKRQLEEMFDVIIDAFTLREQTLRSALEVANVK